MERTGKSEKVIQKLSLPQNPVSLVGRRFLRYYFDFRFDHINLTLPPN